MPDEHRLVAYRKGAGRLAGRRTNSAGYFREIVRRMEQLARLSPVSLVHEVVEVRDRVSQGAAHAVAKGNAAIHTSSRLPPDLLRRKRQVKLVKIVDALFYKPVVNLFTLIFQEALYLTHSFYFQFVIFYFLFLRIRRSTRLF
jgi:hypothetical protein